MYFRLSLLCVLFISLIVYSPLSAFAVKASDPSLTIVKSTMDQLSKAIDQKDGGLALTHLELLKSQLLAVPFKELTHFKGVQSLLNAIDELQQTLLAVKPDFKQWQMKKNKVYLAIDALTHHAQPLWIHYENIINKQVQVFIHSVKIKDAQQVKINWKRITDNIDQISVALQIQSGIHVLDEWNAMGKYIEKGIEKKPIDYLSIVRVEGDITRIVKRLFQPNLPTLSDSFISKRGFTHHWYFWPLSIGTLIISVLAFFGIRNYFAVYKTEIRHL